MSPAKKKPLKRPRPVRRPKLPQVGKPPAPSSPKSALEELAALAADASLEVPSDALQRLLAYLSAMLAKNEEINLTAIRDTTRARVLHILDSLHVWNVHAAPKLAIDIGSGNGFPGVAIAALWPECSVLLVDRTQKKARAIQSCLETAGIGNARGLAADAAQLPALRPELCGRAQLVTLRAVAPLGRCLQLAAPFLAKTGVAAIFKASALDDQEAAEGAEVARRLRLTALPEQIYLLPGDETRARRLLCFRAR